MNVKVAAVLIAMLFVVCVPEGDAFTAGAGMPKKQGRREQVLLTFNF